MTERTERIAGLDLLRALAIVLVVLAHYPKTGSTLLDRALNFGWTGVDLFFVLSGYLIGGQLLKPVALGEHVALGQFYLRRFLRTLPNYYVILAVYFLLIPTPESKYLLFAQNFGIPRAFAPSWSLCVEEQFYLLFPLIVIGLRSVRWLAYSVPALLIAEFGVRAAIWFHVRPDLASEPQALSIYMGHLYYPTYCRLDGIVLGVGLAALKWFRPLGWQRLMERGNQLLLASGALLAGAMLALWKHYSFLCSTAGFSLLNLSFVLLAAAALSPKCLLTRCNIWGAKQIALLSYSIYLTHSLALEAARRMFEDSASVAAISASAGIIIAFACALYYSVERPSLALRDRFLKRTDLHRPAMVPAREVVRST
jgi:peptidoglycan/LPS O-acetylase OafA/YrhL